MRIRTRNNIAVHSLLRKSRSISEYTTTGALFYKIFLHAFHRSESLRRFGFEIVLDLTSIGSFVRCVFDDENENLISHINTRELFTVQI